MNISENILYLASQSPSRQELLRRAHIPFVVTGHAAHEYCDENLSLEQLVQELALLKMEYACLPIPVPIRFLHSGEAGDAAKEIFVLTADTLTCDMQGNVFGKPRDRQQAIDMIKGLRHGTRVATGFCVDKKILIGGKWETHKRMTSVVSAECVCDVPDTWIDRYLENTPALHVAGGLVVDDYGSLFVKKIVGSYSAIIGLPLEELRASLDALGFFRVA